MLLVAYLATLLTLNNLRVRTFACLVTYLVALKAKLGITFERVMGVLTTEYAIWTPTFVGAFFCHVAKLFAISTFNGWVFLYEVTGHLVLQTLEEIIVCIFFLCRLHYGLETACCRVRLISFLCFCHMSSEIHITFDCSARYD